MKFLSMGLHIVKRIKGHFLSINLPFGRLPQTIVFKFIVTIMQLTPAYNLDDQNLDLGHYFLGI